MNRIFYEVPIINEGLDETQKHLKISGEAIHEGITRNRFKYTAEELKRAAPSLKGRPILTDHEQKVKNIVGTVEDANFDNTKVAFKGTVMDEGIQKMIKDGRIQSVSIGAGYKQLIKESDDNGDYHRIEGLEFHELSFVAVPGDPNAAISQAIAVAESLNRSDVMEPTTKEQDAPPGGDKDAIIAELKKKIAELEAKLADKKEPPKEAVPEVPKENLEVKQIKEELNQLKEMLKPKSKSIVTDTNTSEPVKEGLNRTAYKDGDKKFVVEQGRNGVSFWEE